MTTAKIKPLIFSVSGFAFSYAANMFMPMILYDLCLLPAQFYYITVYMPLQAMCKLWLGVHLGKFPMVPRTLFSRRCNFKTWVSPSNFQAQQT
jgi:hypothetical protein